MRIYCHCEEVYEGVRCADVGSLRRLHQPRLCRMLLRAVLDTVFANETAMYYVRGERAALVPGMHVPDLLDFETITLACDTD